jgi:hypothetical protein
VFIAGQDYLTYRTQDSFPWFLLSVPGILRGTFIMVRLPTIQARHRQGEDAPAQPSSGTRRGYLETLAVAVLPAGVMPLALLIPVQSRMYQVVFPSGIVSVLVVFATQLSATPHSG